MTALIFDGPEATGKSTLISALQEVIPGSRIRKWGPVASWGEYVSPLIEDMESEEVVLWDRSWASELVYNDLMNRGRSVKSHQLRYVLELPLLHRGGLMFMVLTPPSVLEARRLEREPGIDLEVDPVLEWKAFDYYARAHNWVVLSGQGGTGANISAIQELRNQRNG